MTCNPSTRNNSRWRCLRNEFGNGVHNRTWTQLRLLYDSRIMNLSLRRLLFLLFFLSGFCSLVYQVVWTRMAFAAFGIISPVLSVVLSVFMLGLSVGAWAGGRFVKRLSRTPGLSAAFFYAGVELMIGLGGALAVPKLFELGEHCLLSAGQTNSFNYLFRSALVLAAAIFPWCVFMGATFPLMMAYIRERERNNQESFSYLYLANVLGAMSGTLWTALVSVEVLGFQKTLWDAAACNGAIAMISVFLGWNQRQSFASTQSGTASLSGPVLVLPFQGTRNRLVKWLLFSTGFSAMAMEVIWIRAFTPVLLTQVYSFASIVCVYLGATFSGSLWYRRDLRNGRVHSLTIMVALLALTAFLPALANDFRLIKVSWPGNVSLTSSAILLASICPFCAALGYLTPGLIDRYAAGDPAEAGRAYAINVVGCIFGPLIASYVLLPWISEKSALIVLSLPFLGYYLQLSKSLSLKRRWAWGLIACAAWVWAAFFTEDYETFLKTTEKNTIVRRDYAASTISFGEGRYKYLFVNGVGMTGLTPITKFMAHLPLAFHHGRPQSALIICFGMGTTYRSALSWDVNTTTVELVPGVVQAFDFYYADAARCLDNPRGRIVIDDGRRFLKRTTEKFDIIVIDPPPPPEAAGSSLLYSREFYELAKQHLKPHGILQTWVPGAETSLVLAAVRSVSESFPYTRGFGPVQGAGIHLLASMDPIDSLKAEQLAARMPEEAKNDLLEWSSTPDLAAYWGIVLSRETPIKESLDSVVPERITDDHPYNEYFLLRRANLF
jgi:spermidine synthase